MPRFRKRPVEIEAIQWDGSPEGVFATMGQLDTTQERTWSFQGGKLLIDTLEGTMAASPGDYIIRGIHGELYPCKPDIFAATYEAA